MGSEPMQDGDPPVGADEKDVRMIDRAALRQMFEDLMDGAEAQGGVIDADAFWGFCAALSQGRGITERLHVGGLEAVADLNPQPVRTAGRRTARAYQLGFLRQLLVDIGRLPGLNSIFPKNFRWEVIAYDLGNMLGGPTSEGTGTPLILSAKGESKNPLRRTARETIVGTVYYRSVRGGKSIARVRAELLPDMDKSKWDKWAKESKAVRDSAIAAAKSGTPSDRFGKSDDELRPIIQLAKG